VIARRVVAVVVAVGLVVGAYVVRTRVIEDDDAEADGPSSRPATELVCVRDLEAVCRALDVEGVDVVVEDADTTLRRLTTAEQDELGLWLTIDPYPAMVTRLRTSAGRDDPAWTTREVATSRLALVTRDPAKATALGAACPTEAARWPCLGELAGEPWATVEPAIGGDVRPALAPVDRYSTGLLSLGQAARAWFGDRPVDVDDPLFLSWLRPVHRTSDGAQLSAGTPIRTILVRPSALDVAVGAEAELGASPGDAAQVTYAGPMTSADVVLAAPAAVRVPDGLAAPLADALVAAGWDAADPSTPSGAASPADLLALAGLWEEL
jgi:hypothetical protein